MLKIYNTLTGRKEDLKPITPGKVRMYVCGMTVYDYCHLGHARVMVVFDVVARYLRCSGYDLTYVRNITDIDDKIIKRAQEAGEPVGALTERFIEYMNEDAAALGVARPDREPRATEHIATMVGMIEKLMARGHAYVGASGDVYYDVSRFPDYGKLSGKRLDELRAGARVEVEEAKTDPLDFVLWKRAKPGEPAWESPWGAGRPGWHIECSAMSTHCLGEHFDIHGGGLDLQFPHHENEIAQSQGATGQPFVNLWMHNGFVRVDEEKMSKSLGNFFTVREVLARYHPEEVRYFILASHYRSPLNYSDEHLNQARHALTRLYLSLRDAPQGASYRSGNPYAQRFRATMDDDFNTPDALAVLFDLARELNRGKEGGPEPAADLAATLRHLGAVLGLLQREPDDYLTGASLTVPLPSAHSAGGQVGSITVPETQGQISAEQTEELVRQRTAARARKDWAESDRIRAQLAERGIVLEDGPTGTRWRRQ